MQSTHVAHFAVFATGVCAAPLNPVSSRATCDIQTCVVALQPSFPTACDPAAGIQALSFMSSQKLLTDKLDPPLNTACLAAAAKGTAPPPSPPHTARNDATGNTAATNGEQGIVATPAANNNARSWVRRVSSPSSHPSLCARRPLTTWELQLVQHRVPYRGRQGYCCLSLRFDRCAAQFGVTDPGASAQAAAVAIN
ncbi:hypothetical protein B0H13DRAFT_2321922 [Mycena leptocephala]|nr:hypothetical protein B0H13DRAFT_2321922 [Mycena leptocephala]